MQTLELGGRHVAVLFELGRCGRPLCLAECGSGRSAYDQTVYYEADYRKMARVCYGATGLVRGGNGATGLVGAGTSAIARLNIGGLWKYRFYRLTE